jgi:IS5 family transposase
MYPATTGRPPCAPLKLFKMSLLQHCYGLSNPQCEELVSDRLSWRRFVGLGLQDAMPDETTLVRFRQRLSEHGRHENLLALVNRQLQTKGLILKTCTLVDATLLQAARHAPAKDNRTGGDGDAGYTVKKGQPHYGYKAPVAVGETHTLIRQMTLRAANVHDRQEFENVVRGDEEMVMADKAYWSKARSEWCGQHGVANGILRRPSLRQKLRPARIRANRLFRSIRCKIETVFAWGKRSADYRRVQYVGHAANRCLGDAARKLFTTELSVPVLAAPELYGSKLVAAMDRQHPRDLFDVHGLFERDGLASEVVECVVCYLGGHNRPVHEVLFSRDADMSSAFENEFAGMAWNPVTLAELQRIRRKLKSELRAALTPDQRRFLLGLVSGEPDWALMKCPPPVAVASYKMETSKPCQTQEIQSRQVHSIVRGASCQTYWII